MSGTVDALCVTYYKSSGWTSLAEYTKDARRRIIEKFRVKHGTKRVRLLAKPHLVKIMGEITSPSAQRSRLKAIRHLLQHAVPTMRKDNPAERIAQVKLPKSKGHWTWCAYRKSNPGILVVQSAQDRATENASNCLGGA